MFKAFYHAFFYDPLYNGLVVLLAVLPPWANAGIAIILFTIIVKLILFPLTRAAIRSQVKMKQLEPKMSELRERHKNDREKQSLELLKLYKENKLNPFSGIFIVLIQIPIIFALYRIFLLSGLPSINSEILYSFVTAPGSVDMNFFGVDLASKNYIVAALAAVSQFFQSKYALPNPPTVAKGAAPSFKDDFAKTMHMQMRYVLPVFVFFISYHIAAAASLYWVTSNIFAIVQELVVRRRLHMTGGQTATTIPHKHDEPRTTTH